MRGVGILTAFAIALPCEVDAQVDEAAAAVACLTPTQRQELFHRITSASAATMFSASMGMSQSTTQASAAHSRALAALRQCEGASEGTAVERCAKERATVDERAKDEAELAAEKKRRIAEARATLAGTIKSIRAEYPDCEQAR